MLSLSLVATYLLHEVRRLTSSAFLHAIFSLTLLSLVSSSFVAARPAVLQQDTIQPKFSVSPDQLQRGTEYDLYIRTEPESFVSELDPESVKASSGSGVTIKSARLSADKRSLIVAITVDDQAAIGLTRLQVFKMGQAENPYLVELSTIAERPLERQPTPGGISEVDAMWMVVPERIARDNFGRRITNQYYCIEAVIGNNSGYDIQLASIGFNANISSTDTPEVAKIPTTSRRMVGASLVRENEFGRRAVTFAALTGLGTVASAFIPFFKVPTRQANYSTLTSIFGNQLSTLEIK